MAQLLATTVNGNLTVNGQGYAQAWNISSSIKVKENVHPTEINATDLINQVKVVDFNYINDDEKTPKIGFIAENTPSLLSTPHNNVMDVANCIGLLLKANQELAARVKALEEKGAEK